MTDDSLLSRVFSRLGRRDQGSRLSSSLGADLTCRLLAQLAVNGYGPKTDSWRENGSMTPIAAGDIEAGIGRELMSEITSTFVIPPEQAADMPAQNLPAIVRHFRAAGDLPA